MRVAKLQRLLLTTAVFLYLFLSVIDGWLIIEKGVPLSPSIIIIVPMLLLALPSLYKRVGFVFISLSVLYISFLILLLMLNNIEGVGTFFVLLIYPLICFLLFSISTEIEHKDLILLLSLSVAIVCFLVVFYNVSYLQGRLTIAVGYNPTFFAGMLVGVIYGALYFFQKYSFLSKIITIFSLAVIGYALIGTGGRNAILSLALSFLVVLLIESPKVFLAKYLKRSRVLFLFVPFFLAMGLVAFSGLISERSEFQIDFERFSKTFSSESSGDEATAGRTTIWSDYVSALNNGAMFLGLDGATKAVESGRPAHNMYITLAVEIFFLIPLGILISIFYAAVKIFKFTDSLVLRAFPLYVCFFMIGNDVFYYKYFWFCVMIFSICLGAEVRNKSLIGKLGTLSYG